MEKVHIIFSGEGGQGIQAIAKIFSSAVVKSGKEVVYMPSFGVEQRGTPSLAFVTLGDHALRYPRFETADYVIVLQTRALKAVERYISPNTKVIFDSSTISYQDIPNTTGKLYGIPATKYSIEKFNPKSFNLMVLGAVSSIFKLKEDVVWAEIMAVLGKKFKTDEILNQNKEAFLFGREAVFEEKEFTKATHKTRHSAIICKGYGKKGEILPARCKGCGICIEKCPVAALSFSEDLGVFATAVPKVDLEKCIACGNCRAYCPDGAISMEKDSSPN